MGTKIGWTDQTWNPTTGCSRVSEGCRHCYAESLSLRNGWSRKPWTHNNAPENVVLHPERLRKPYSWKTPSRVFVNSMSDLFHEQVPDAFIAQVFAVMADLPQHTFQVLTKRPERAATWPGPWPANVWMGTSTENQRAADERIPHLLRTPAAVRFISAEPLLGPLDIAPYLWATWINGRELPKPTNWIGLDSNMYMPPYYSARLLPALDWVIVGGESGAHIPSTPERHMDHGWARSIRDQCVAAGVAFWFKQSSSVRTEMGTELIEVDGTTTVWRQFPDDAATIVTVAAPEPVPALPQGQLQLPLF